MVAERRGEYDSGCEAAVLRAALYSYEVFNEARWMTDHLRLKDGKPTVLAALEMTFLHLWSKQWSISDPDIAGSCTV
jgi:hypothetical protein